MKIIKMIMALFTKRLFIFTIIISLEFLFLLFLILWFNSDDLNLFYIISYIVGIITSIYIVNGKTNPGYKIAWIMVILIFPIVGLFIYLCFGGNQLNRWEKNKLKEIYYHQKRNIFPNSKVMKKLKREDITAYNQANYITKYSLSPLCENTKCTYFKIGEDYYERLISELSKAKKYIFLEYFIISNGKMWNTILNILKKKVKEGVEVRVMYDDFGCIMTLPNKYYKTLESYGIKSCTFNRFVPILRSKFNNRDHRKMAIIDGIIGFTGGINLADEYINEKVRFGHWKDNGIMLYGDAVWNMTIMFMSLWDFAYKDNYSYRNYMPNYKKLNIKADGYIIPYNDNPWDHEATGETIYLNLINKATKFIYITTPYLIIDNEMVTSLCMAAKNGIDVKIICPKIPDKKMINEVTKAYYTNLMESGVKIYEYSPGFIHAKTFIVDGIYATVGTVNLDYRSLYLHFENGVWMYRNSVIKDIQKDFIDTLEKSEEIYLGKEKLKSFQKFKRQMLMAFAPLM